MLLARGREYGDLLEAVLHALDPPGGEQITHWTIRQIGQEPLEHAEHREQWRPAVLCVTYLHGDVPPAGV